MIERFAELLWSRIEAAGQTWPLRDERNAVRQVLKWAAFRETDRDALKTHHPDWKADRRYMVDSLPEKISEAFASLLFGEDPRFTPGGKDDADRLQDIITTADLPAELRWGAMLSSSEGEAWWRVFADDEIADHPLIEFHSRSTVVPHFIGPKLVAVAFVSEYDGTDTEPNEAQERRTVWRHFELHTMGGVENRLYRGTADKIGKRNDLEAHPQTADLEEIWEHDLPGLLCGRVINKRGRDRRLGKSDYDQIEDYLFELNETITVGHENMKLTLKKRMVVPQAAVRPITDAIDEGDGSMTPVNRGTANLDDDLIIAETMNETLGEGATGPYTVLEYSFDADELVAYKRDLIETAASRSGLTAHFIQTQNSAEGSAESGTALRVRLIPTTSAVNGKGKYWAKQIPVMVHMAQLLDGLSIENGGFGRTWSAGGDQPSVELTDPLPIDATEQTAIHVARVGAEIESHRTAIKELHPEWDDAQLEEELKLIEDGKPKVQLPQFPPPNGDPGNPDDPEEDPENPGSEGEPPA